MVGVRLSYLDLAGKPSPELYQPVAFPLNPLIVLQQNLYSAVLTAYGEVFYRIQEVHLIVDLMVQVITEYIDGSLGLGGQA